MEKVKVTREVAEAIKWAMDENRIGSAYRDNPSLLLSRHGYSKHAVNETFLNNLAPLNDIETGELAKALYIGYEVEPEYKVGDWVSVFMDNGTWKCTAEITSIAGEYFTVDVNNVLDEELHLSFVGWDTIRHATPEEIKQEKERRTDRKLNELLSTLSNEELNRLRERLKCGLDVCE